jgi:hypothetical protein
MKTAHWQTYFIRALPHGARSLRMPPQAPCFKLVARMCPRNPTRDSR